MYRIIKIWLLLAGVLLVTPAFAVDLRLDWKTLESAHFRVHFHEGAETLAQKTANIAERVHENLTPVFGWKPAAKTEIVLSDHIDFPNGAASPVPFNYNLLFISPPRELNSLEDFDDWLELLITHEYAHILHLDKVSGFWSGVRRVFGRFVFAFPNVFQPVWLIEGLATYHETGEEHGRGQSSLFAMQMRAEVENGLKPISQVNLPIREWPAGTTRYLYGVHFFQFVEERYGAGAIRKHIDIYSSNFMPFRLTGTSRRVYGKDIKTLWAEFEDYLRERYQPQIDAVRKQGVIEGRALTDGGLMLDSPRIAADGGAYYIRNTAYKKPSVMFVDSNGKHRRIANVHNGARLDYHPQGGLLITQPEVCGEYNLYSDIYRILPGKRRVKRLTKCGRYVFAAWHPAGDKIAAVQNKLGTSELHLLNAKGKQAEILWRGDTHSILSYLDWSPSGDAIVVSIWRDGRWNLETFDLATRRWNKLTDDANIQSQPQYTADGRSIFYTSDRNGGIYNIWRYDLADTRHHKLTHVVGGAFEPSYDNKHDALYYVAYGANGYDLHQLSGVSPLAEIKPATTATSNAVQSTEHIATAEIPRAAAGENDQGQNYPARDYSPWSTLRPRWWLPIFGFYSDGAVLGATTGGNDALGAHVYNASVAVDSVVSSPLGFLSYTWANRFTIGIGRNLDITLIDDGDDDATNDEIARASAHDVFEMIYRIPFTRYDQSWNFLAYAGRDREHDLETAPFIEPQAEIEDQLLGAALVFNNSDRFHFSISPNTGRQIRLVYENSDKLDGDYSGEIYTLDWREFLPLGGQHVLALRAVGGWGTDAPSPFELGGEDGVLSRDNIFNRRNYSLRGYPEGLSQLEGRRMWLESAEWRFPISRLERGAMAPPVGITQMHGAFFYEAGAAWNEGDSPERYYRSHGFELNTELVIGYGLLFDLHLGYAQGKDEGGENRWYLNFGASF